MPSFSDFYERLGIPQDASEDEIRIAFHKAAHRLHPDVNLEDGATELFLEIKEAYEVLIDSDKRKVYDGKSGDAPPPPVRTAIHFSRNTLPWMAENQLVYTLIEMEVLADQLEKEDDSSPPINIALVLDTSTSMQGARLEMVKASAIELIRNLRSQDILSIVTFNDRAETILPAASQANNVKSESRVRMLQAKGGTELFQGLNAAFMEVRRNLSPYYINHIILVTDGHTYGDEGNCNELALKAADQDVGISSLGIGTEWNDVFLDSLANITGGSCFYIHDPRDIRTLLKQKFSDLGQVYAESIKLNFRVGPGVTLNYAYRLLPEANPLPTTPPIRLGNIPKGSHLSFLLEFLLAPITPSVHKVLLGEGSFTFVIPKLGESTYRIPLNLILDTSANPQAHPPKKIIIEAMSRLTLYRMGEQAKKEIEAGDYQKASSHLQNMATHLFSQGEPELAKTALSEVKNINSRKEISREGQKRIKYGTQALVIPPNKKRASNS
jgi:Ca-activated chloride channel family protein